MQFAEIYELACFLPSFDFEAKKEKEKILRVEEVELELIWNKVLYDEATRSFVVILTFVKEKVSFTMRDRNER